VHPYSGEAGAIGALWFLSSGGKRAAEHIPRLRRDRNIDYKTTTAKETVCNWCPVNLSAQLYRCGVARGNGREWSKVPLSLGWERVIVNNSCPKGLVEDLNEMKVIKAGIEKTKNAYPILQTWFGKKPSAASPPPPKDRSGIRIGIPKS